MFRRFAADEVSPAQLVDRPGKCRWDIKDCGLWPGEDARAIEPPEAPTGGRHEARWTLWRDLRDRRAEVLAVPCDEPSWTPFRFALDRERNHVVFSFDQRLADRAVRGALKAELPKLRDEAGVARLILAGRRESRPRPGALRLSGIPVSASWRERVAGWLTSRYVKSIRRGESRIAATKGRGASRRISTRPRPRLRLSGRVHDELGRAHEDAALTRLAVRRPGSRAVSQVQEMNDQAERALAGDRAAQEAEVAAVRKALGDDVAERLQRSLSGRRRDRSPRRQGQSLAMWQPGRRPDCVSIGETATGRPSSCATVCRNWRRNGQRMGNHR